MSDGSHERYIQHQVALENLGFEYDAVEEKRVLTMVSILGAKLSIDGDMHCFLYGENLQEGVSGFGKSPMLAAIDFSKQFKKELKVVK
jgi:hypothetical protein